ncbi:dioxygenase [Microbacterium sp. CFBP9034]|uniref:dioxygenase n=1 Tax=Microbacterium sp. CFBP9034 TaxID=3096540 RepID=UPI002A6991EB|nr:dioxygenase [Microbacterium sp. CFBP9034]MDY0909761.1 dioxygenase [Microbacterium sp. CFBP9034]
MATGGKDREAREARERARLYQARQEFHRDRARRRTRDNLIAGIAGGVLIVGVLAVQTAYFVAGPGAPEPTPTSTSTPGVTPGPTGTPTPTPSVTSPMPSVTPTPTP